MCTVEKVKRYISRYEAFEAAEMSYACIVSQEVKLSHRYSEKLFKDYQKAAHHHSRAAIYNGKIMDVVEEMRHLNDKLRNIHEGNDKSAVKNLEIAKILDNRFRDPNMEREEREMDKRIERIIKREKKLRRKKKAKSEQ